MTKEIDITPKTHAIASLRRQDMPAWLAVCELVDNSFDAKASVVGVEWDASKRCISVTDDGVGAPNPAAIVTIGDHDSEGRDTSGRYGIGAKDAVLALGTAAEVLVVRNGIRRVVRADFEEVRVSGRWVAREDQEPAFDSISTGTVVKVLCVDRRIDRPVITSRLSRTFAPAIRRGKVITLDGQRVEAPRVVEVDDRREGSGEFRGRLYSWWAGIKRDGEKADGGWRFEFKHRALPEDSCNRSYGTEGMDIHKFYGVITLVEPDDADESERWAVNKHKTSAEDVQDLCERIFPEIRDLLERCAAEHSLTIEAGIADDVGRGLTEALSGVSVVKEKRSRRQDEELGTVEPGNTGRRRRRAAKTQPGDGSVTVRDPLTGKRFSINFADDERFGWVTGSRKANVIYLGKLHDYWQIHAMDREIVQCVAMSLLAGQAVTTDDSEQPIMAAVVSCDAANERFFNTLGNIASQVASVQETVHTNER
jgi:hypothetical protein